MDLQVQESWQWYRQQHWSEQRFLIAVIRMTRPCVNNSWTHLFAPFWSPRTSLLKFAYFEKEGDVPALHESSMTSDNWWATGIQLVPLITSPWQGRITYYLETPAGHYSFLLMLPSMLLVSLHCGACCLLFGWYPNSSRMGICFPVCSVLRGNNLWAIGHGGS